MSTFDNVIDSITDFSIDEKLELADLIRKQAIEERRIEIKFNAENTISDFNNGTLIPTSIDDFFRSIN